MCSATSISHGPEKFHLQFQEYEKLIRKQATHNYNLSVNITKQ